jgi:RNA ligase (TIGR02306 family)
MPSPLVVPVTTISSLLPHPNADRLEIAQVLGWQCVVQKGQYQEGSKVMYFPPDTILPQELSDSWGVTQYLEKGRIKATRLRGEPSFGLVMPCDHDEWSVGENVAEQYGVTKYEPPQRLFQGKSIPNPNAVARNPFFPEYTHIHNLRNYPNLFFPEELLVITEKLHGTNSRIGKVQGEWMAGSHRVQRGEKDALYWSPRRHAERLVEELAQYHTQVVLYGEILGSGIQSLSYGYEGCEGYRAFDLLVDGHFVDHLTFQSLCIEYEVPTVPVLLEEVRFSLSDIQECARGETRLNGDHLREGVVIKPLLERTDPRIGRVILKYVSNDFLLGKQSDFSEV